MKKYDLQEGDESLKRVLLMMNYDNKKTLSENVEVINEDKAIRNKGQGIDRLFTSLNNLNPKKLSKLPTWSNGKSIINLGTQNIQNIKIKTNIGNLYFFTFKPGGYFTNNNFVLKVKNGEATIGTWDLDRMYFKKDGDRSISDKGFNNTINFSDLNLTTDNKKKPQDTTPQDTTPQDPPKARYRNCDNEGKYTIGCITKPEGDIGRVQSCLGIVQDGKFWTKTQEALKNAGFSDGFTKEDISKICGSQPQQPQQPQQSTEPEQEVNMFSDYESETTFDDNF